MNDYKFEIGATAVYQSAAEECQFLARVHRYDPGRYQPRMLTIYTVVARIRTERQGGTELSYLLSDGTEEGTAREVELLHASAELLRELADLIAAPEPEENA